MSACLGEASKSQLHYRHGCVIVRGGKVLGRGFNGYRPGFNGGALKTGQLASVALDGPALIKLKLKHKAKSQCKDATIKETATFVPFEDNGLNGGGHIVNAPLSLHSEMAAIVNALSNRSTFAAKAMLSKKRRFLPPNESKRRGKNPREALTAYIERVCVETPQSPQALQYSNKLQVQELRFEASPSQSDQQQLQQVQRGEQEESCTPSGGKEKEEGCE